MADNRKFIDAAVGYRPQTAFPLNANEYFESLAAASAAVSSAAEVGTEGSLSTSYYIGQTVTVYDKDEGAVSLRQIQPDGKLKPVGQGIQEIPVDGVSIGKEADGTLYLKAVPDGMLDPATIYKEDGKIALKAVPEDMLTGYGYVKLSSLTGYIEPSGEKKYKIQTASDGAAYVHVPWSGGGEIPQTYKTYSDTVTALTSESGFRTYFQTSTQLSNDGYATQAWVQEQGFAGGGISLSDVQATIFDFGDGDLSSFGWTGELNLWNLIGAGIKASATIVVKHPVAVRIGNGVTSIGDFAFQGCSLLTNVTIPTNVTSIGKSAFQGCASLTNVTIPNSVTSIERSAFSYCSELLSVAIPNSVTSIGRSAFSQCNGLTNVIISNGVMSIGDFAFSGCSGLTSVTIGNGVTSIGNYAFSGCNELFEITVEGKTQAEAEALLANASAPAGCRIKTWNFEPRRNYDVPVFEQTFTNVNLAGRKLYYPAICQEERTVDSTDDIRVWRVMFMQSKHQPGTPVFKVSDGSGSGVVLSANMLSDTVFSYTTIDWPYPVTDYLSVTNITGTAATANIDVLLRGYEHGYPDAKPYTYYGVKGEVDMYMYSNVKKIGAYAFNGVSGLTSTGEHVEFPKAMSVGRCAFEKLAGVKTIDLGNVYEIGDAAFRYMPDLVSANIGNNVIDIPVSAFYNCEKISSVTIGSSVTSIGNQAFSGCRGLSSVTIGDSVTSVGDWAFSRCSRLTSVTIGSSVTSIGDYAFVNCTNVTDVVVPGWQCRIPFGAVTNLAISEGTTSIGAYAFSDCSSLTSVTIPGSVTDIGYAAFSRCSGLSSVIIPDGVTRIGTSAFYSCSGLSSMTIPDSVTSIDSYAFSGCRLTGVMFEGNAPTVGSNAFIGVTSGCTAYVHRSSSGWGVTIPGTWQGINIAYIEDQTA